MDLQDRTLFLVSDEKTRFSSFGNITRPITPTIWKAEEGETHYMDFWGIPSSKWDSCFNK